MTFELKDAIIGLLELRIVLHKTLDMIIFLINFLILKIIKNYRIIVLLLKKPPKVIIWMKIFPKTSLPIH